MGDPIVHTPSGLYRPRPLLSGHRGIVGPTGDIWDESASNSLSGMTVASTGEIADPLMDNLTHMWRMNESTSRLDQIGDLDLIKYNSPQVVVGRVNNATRFPESALAHLYANGDRINPGNNNFEVTMWIRWFRVDDFGDLDIMVEWGNEGTTVAFRLWYNTSSSYYRWACGGGTPWKTVSRVLNNWVFIDVFFNTQSNLCGIDINNSGTFAQAAATSYPTTINTNPDLVFGAYQTGSVFNDSIDVDAVHVWEGYNLTAAERTYMYNSGFGRELV